MTSIIAVFVKMTVHCSVFEKISMFVLILRPLFRDKPVVACVTDGELQNLPSVTQANQRRSQNWKSEEARGVVKGVAVENLRDNAL